MCVLLSFFFKERGGLEAVERGSRPREEGEHGRAARDRSPSKSRAWRMCPSEPPISTLCAVKTTEARKIARYVASRDASPALAQGSGECVIDHCFGWLEPLVILAYARRTACAARRCRRRSRRDESGWDRERWFGWQRPGADVPDGIAAQVRFNEAGAPEVRTFDLHPVARSQVVVAETGLRSVCGNSVGALAEAANTDAEGEPRRTARGKRKASRSIGDTSGKPKSDRHRGWDK